MINTDKPTVYNFFDEHGVFMLNNGIVSPNLFSYYIRYKVYLDFLAQGFTHDEAMSKAGKRNKCSRWSIYRAIKFMTDPNWRREKPGQSKRTISTLPTPAT